MPTVTVTSKNFSNVNWSVQVGSDDAIPLDKWAKNVVNSGSSVSFTAPVSSENVTLIAEEGTAPAPGGNDAGAAVSGGSGDGAGAAVVIGGAAIGAAYLVGTQVWMKANLPGGVIPTSRQQTALMLWDAAGKPQPQNAALYTDIAAAETDAQQAARWCAEQGLLKDYAEGTAFKPGRYIFRPQVIRAWNQLQTLSRAE